MGSKMTKLKLSYIRDIMRNQISLEKAIMLGKIEDSKKRGRPNMRLQNRSHRHESIVAEQGC